MFTGLIGERGTLLNSSKKHQLTIVVRTMLEGLSAGNSIAANGVHLAVISFTVQSFTAGVMPETLRCSNLGVPRAESQVNLGRALPINGRLSGYLVSGHVDDTGGLLGIHRENNTLPFPVRATPTILQGIIEEGSVAVDSIDLIMVSVDRGRFSVSVIPHTAAVTTLAAERPGDKLNFETSLLGKYMLRALSPAGEDGTGKRSRINEE